MASILKQAESLQVKIEKYIKRIGGNLPTVKGDEDLLGFLLPILKQDSERNKSIRVALGFPAKIETSRMLSKLISSNEASVRPMTSVWAQRMYQFLWRLESTVREIDASWHEPVLRKIEAAQTLCEPHLLARRPNLPEISGALKFKTNLTVVSESAADATLFAVLRAFELREEDQLLWACPGKREARVLFAITYMRVGMIQREAVAPRHFTVCKQTQRRRPMDS